jgi:hypothetical protein
MSVSFQDQARRENAQKSTGPKTEAGKARSRANSTTHGLAGKGGVLPADLAEAAAERQAELRAPGGRCDAHSRRLAQEMVLSSLRVDACRMARKHLVEER